MNRALAVGDACGAEGGAAPVLDRCKRRIGAAAAFGEVIEQLEALRDLEPETPEPEPGQEEDSISAILFDIIDESAHVQYAHKWLSLLAEHAGVDNSDYRERAVRLLVRDGIHFHGPETPTETKITGLVGFHDHVACSTIHRQFQQVVEDLRV